MSIVYVSEPKVKLSVDSNRMVIEYPDGMKKFVPIETRCKISYIYRLSY